MYNQYRDIYLLLVTKNLFVTFKVRIVTHF